MKVDYDVTCLHCPYNISGINTIECLGMSLKCLSQVSVVVKNCCAYLRYLALASVVLIEIEEFSVKIRSLWTVHFQSDCTLFAVGINYQTSDFVCYLPGFPYLNDNVLFACFLLQGNSKKNKNR